jgi:hypothetical protein
MSQTCSAALIALAAQVLPMMGVVNERADLGGVVARGALPAYTSGPCQENIFGSPFEAPKKSQANNAGFLNN